MCRMLVNSLRVIFSAAVLLFYAPHVAAQNYPSRTITILVGIGAGGLTDVTTRLYAEVIARNLEQHRH